MCWDAVSTCTGGAGVESERRARLRACCGELPRRSSRYNGRSKQPRQKEGDVANRPLRKVWTAMDRVRAAGSVILWIGK